ncbi:HK97 gp10 family phage protein [Rhizobium sp. P38BS-XIX]|uniref:HK97 gp10 family phage protein n=1 Tax=Rhizobium sp. P38BS-XIX TaxID=2726740 RepID=UPI0014569E3B|nr:HK97 gp10 family phage protein [Rhizobium sp. P38BS-XIX]NLR96621.1 HK97 gp10 family phage protein [Rhizobium sp. P38BS-XIX]
MASSNFSADIAAWAERTKTRMEEVVNLSAQRLAEAIVEATPAVSGELTNSFRVSAAPLQSGDAEGADEGQSVDLAGLGVPLGGLIHLGFTASHAAEVEYGKDGQAGQGMVRLAAQTWPDIVASVARDTTD